MYAPCNIYWHKWENSKEKYHLTLWSFENWSKTCCAEPSKVWKARSNLCPTAGPGIEHPRLRDSDNRTARLTLFYPSFKDFTLSCTLQHANRYTLISCTYTHQYEVEQCQHWPPGYSYTHLYFATCIKAVEKWHDHITELRSNYRYPDHSSKCSHSVHTFTQSHNLSAFQSLHYLDLHAYQYAHEHASTHFQSRIEMSSNIQYTPWPLSWRPFWNRLISHWVALCGTEWRRKQKQEQGVSFQSTAQAVLLHTLKYKCNI